MSFFKLFLSLLLVMVYVILTPMLLILVALLPWFPTTVLSKVTPKKTETETINRDRVN